MNQVQEKGISVTKQLKELAETLVSTTHIPHQYFEVGSLLLINVSYSPDGLQEYSTFKKDELNHMYYKFESLTISWMKVEKLAKWLIDYHFTKVDEFDCTLCNKPIQDCHCSISFRVPFRNFENFKREFAEFAKRY